MLCLASAYIRSKMLGFLPLSLAAGVGLERLGVRRGGVAGAAAAALA